MNGQNKGFVLNPESYLMGVQPAAPPEAPPPPSQTGFRLEPSSYLMSEGAYREFLRNLEQPPSKPLPTQILNSIMGFLKGTAEEAGRTAKTAGAGFYGGAAATAGLLDKAAGTFAERRAQRQTELARKFGEPEKAREFKPEEFKTRIFSDLEQQWQGISERMADEWSSQIPIFSDVISALGRAGWDIPKIMALGGLMPTGAIEGMIEGGPKTAILGGVEGALAHGVIKGIGLLPSKARLPAWFGFGTATTPGDLEDRVVGGLTWAALGLQARGRKLTVRDFLENYPQLQQRLKDHQAWKALHTIAPELTKEQVKAAGGPKAALDKAIEFQRKFADLKARYEEAGLDFEEVLNNPAFAENIQRELALPPRTGFEVTERGTAYRPEDLTEAIATKIRVKEGALGRKLTPEEVAAAVMEIETGTPMPAEAEPETMAPPRITGLLPRPPIFTTARGSVAFSDQFSEAFAEKVRQREIAEGRALTPDEVAEVIVEMGQAAPPVKVRPRRAVRPAAPAAPATPPLGLESARSEGRGIQPPAPKPPEKPMPESGAPPAAPAAPAAPAPAPVTLPLPPAAPAAKPAAKPKGRLLGRRRRSSWPAFMPKDAPQLWLDILEVTSGKGIAPDRDSYGGFFGMEEYLTTIPERLRNKKSPFTADVVADMLQSKGGYGDMDEHALYLALEKSKGQLAKRRSESSPEERVEREAEAFRLDLFREGHKLSPEEQRLADEDLERMAPEQKERLLQDQRIAIRRNELLEKTKASESEIKSFLENALLDGEEARAIAARVVRGETTEETAIGKLKDLVERAAGRKGVSPEELKTEPAAPTKPVREMTEDELRDVFELGEFEEAEAARAEMRRRTEEAESARKRDVRPHYTLTSKEYLKRFPPSKGRGEKFRREEWELYVRWAWEAGEEIPEAVLAELPQYRKKPPKPPSSGAAPAVPAVAEPNMVYVAAKNKSGEVVGIYTEPHDGGFPDMLRAAREIRSKIREEHPDYDAAKSVAVASDQKSLKFGLDPGLRTVRKLPAAAEEEFRLAQETFRPTAKAPKAEQEVLFEETPPAPRFPPGFDSRGLGSWPTLEKFHQQIGRAVKDGWIVEYGHDAGKDVWARAVEKGEPGQGSLVRKAAKVPEFGRREAAQLALEEEEPGQGKIAEARTESPLRRIIEEPEETPADRAEKDRAGDDFEREYRELMESYEADLTKPPKGKKKFVRLEVSLPDGSLEDCQKVPPEFVPKIRAFAKKLKVEDKVKIGSEFWGTWDEAYSPKDHLGYIRDVLRFAADLPSEMEVGRKGEIELFAGVAPPRSVRKIIQKIGDAVDVELPFVRLKAKATGLALKLYHPRRNTELDRGIDAVKKLSRTEGKGLRDRDFQELTFLASKGLRFENLSRAQQERLGPAYRAVRKFFDEYARREQEIGVIEEPWPFSAIKRMRIEAQALKSAVESGQARDPEVALEKIKNIETAVDFLQRTKVRFVHIPRFWLEQFWRANEQKAPKILKEFFHERKTLDLERLARWLLDKKYIKPEDLDIRKIMLAYAHNAGHKIALAEIFGKAKSDRLVMNAADAPENWVTLHPQRFPTLRGMKAHPELVDYVERNLLRQHWMNPTISDVMGIIKSLQFYNPFSLSQYSLIQTFWTGAVTSLKAPKSFARAFKWLVGKKDSEYWEAAYWGAFSEPFTPSFRQAQKQIERYLSGQSVVKKLSRMINPYRLSWTLAWQMENFFKAASYHHLRQKGFSPMEAAQIAAKTGADYASIPPTTRKVLNKVFFTPSFLLSMVKAQGEMLTSAVKMIGHPKSTDRMTRQMAKGLFLMAAVLAGKEALMHSLGFKTDKFGLKYFKKYTDDEGKERELVVHMAAPDNVILRLVHDMRNVAKADNNLEALLNRAKWKLHPMWQLTAEVLSKKRADGQPLVDPFEDRKDQVKDILVYSLRRIVRLSELLPEQGEGSLSKLKAFAALREDLGDFGGSVLAAFSIPYTRSTQERRLMWEMRQIQRSFLETKRARPPKTEQEAQEALDELRRQLEERIKKLEEIQ